MNEAAMAALEEKLGMQQISDGTPFKIKVSHFEQALQKITPSVTDKVFAYSGYVPNMFN